MCFFKKNHYSLNLDNAQYCGLQQVKSPEADVQNNTYTISILLIFIEQ